MIPMNPKLKTLLIALLPLVVGLIIGYVIHQPNDNGLYKELESQKKKVELELKANQAKADTLASKLQSALVEVEEAKKAETVESKKTQFWKQEYEKSKRTPVHVNNQRALDSLLSILYPR
jgi:uncharacterized membrane-anchored protein YhcB (DUF1043 family)